MAKGSETRRVILDAAEKLFSMSGYDGTALSAIAEEAGVRQALIHYHFNTKENLFEAMFARRVIPLNTERLRQLRAELDSDNPTAEGVVSAFFRPVLELGLTRTGEGAYYGQLIASTVNANDPRSRRLVNEYFNDMAQQFIAALARTIPKLRNTDPYWGYYWMMGVAIVAIAQNGRLDELSEARCDSGDVEGILNRVVPFVVAGLRGMARSPARPAPEKEAAPREAVMAGAVPARPPRPSAGTAPTAKTKETKPPGE